MMNIEELPPRRSSDEGSDEAEIDGIQMEAAEKAGTVGIFQDRFSNMIQMALDEGRVVDTSLAKERTMVVDDASREIEDLRLGVKKGNVLGDAEINGGRSKVAMSRGRLALMKTTKHAEEMRHAGGHELGHAGAKNFKEQLVLDGEEQKEITMQEGYAELKGNEFVGDAATTHREGQPQKTYKEGQDTLLTIKGIVKDDAMINRMFTQTGDVSEVQEKLDAAGRGREEADQASAA